jgi:adenosine deaminase
MKNLYSRLLFIIFVLFSNHSFAGASEYLKSINTKPDMLYSFFKEMPKGGELHYHFTGSSYPEELIGITAHSNLYLSPKNYTISEHHTSNSVHTKIFFKSQSNLEPTIRAWSMKNLIANYKTKHDHFFNIFPKVMPIYDNYHKELLAKMLTRAASQNEMYMEIIFKNLEKAEDFSSKIQNHKSFAVKKSILLKDTEFNKRVDLLIHDSERYLNDTHNYLKCKTIKPTPKACKVEVRWQTYAMRETDENVFFAQALAAFLAANKSANIVGVNIVQPENGVLALRDFKKQMLVFQFMHNSYPNVHISIHAGELNPKTNKIEDLAHHINDSVYVARAERIGHGTDILYEKHQKKLLNYMASKDIPVEINLISNKLILSVYGKKHPIRYYLKNKVPVVLSTDDEGILETDLTTQYINAAIAHKLDYQTLKLINRNTLTYSFLPGKSLWENPKSAILIKECKNLDSQLCKKYIQNNEKAKLQWQLEKRLIAFENKFN